MGSLFSQPQIASIPGLTAALAGKLAAASNLSDLENFVTAKTNLQLQNVDNTRDTNKPISTATANALDAKAPLASPNFTGAVAVAGGTKVANAPILNLSETWNNAAVTFSGITLNITDTASDGTSRLLDLQMAGVSKFSVRKNGSITFGDTGFSVIANYGGQGRVAWCADGLATPFLFWDGAGNRVHNKSSMVFGWTSTNGNVAEAGNDTALARNAAGVVEFNNGTAGTLRDWKARNGLLTEYFEIDDLTYTPAAPAASKARIWIENDGAGKLQLLVRFPSGAPQLLAIEP